VAVLYNNKKDRKNRTELVWLGFGFVFWTETGNWKTEITERKVNGCLRGCVPQELLHLFPLKWLGAGDELFQGERDSDSKRDRQGRVRNGRLWTMDPPSIVSATII